MSERSWGKVKEVVSLIYSVRKKMEEHVRAELLIWWLLIETRDFLILVLLF